MIITKPKAIIEYISEEPLKRIEACGRTAYKSEDKITDGSAEKFVKMLVDRGHLSVIEHSLMSVRFIVDRGISHELCRHRLVNITQESTRYVRYDGGCKFILPSWMTLPDWVIDQNIGYDADSNAFRIVEGRDENGFVIFKEDGNYLVVDPDDMNEIPSELQNEVSTLDSRTEYIWFSTMYESEVAYSDLLDHGWSPQQARSVLPISLKTELVMTANLREWTHIFKMRADKAAHPQMIEIIHPLLEEVSTRIPIIFDQLKKDYLWESL
jgi:thymidylate synthase (FAD)